MNLTITITEEEANIILAGLSELPLKVSMNTALKVKQQCEEQINLLKTKVEK